MTDGDDGMPEAGTAGDPAALTRQTAPSPLPGAPGVWRGRGPEERAAALETADTVDVPKPWRRPRPVASTRSWPAPCHLDRHAPTHRPRRSPATPPRPLSNGRPSAGGPSTATISSPTGGSDTDYAVDATPTHERDSARRSRGYSRVLASAARAGRFRS